VALRAAGAVQLIQVFAEIVAAHALAKFRERLAGAAAVQQAARGRAARDGARALVHLEIVAGAVEVIVERGFARRRVGAACQQCFGRVRQLCFAVQGAGLSRHSGRNGTLRGLVGLVAGQIIVAR
jgi:hypothetical protein